MSKMIARYSFGRVTWKNCTACIADKTKTNMGHRGTRMDQTDPGAWSAAMAACYPWISILQQCGGGTPGTPSVTSVAPSAPPSQPAAAEGQTGTAATAVYVYVLDGIGLVAATQNSVSTRRACEWAGGGPRPCPNSGPARSVGVLGGPYASEGAAKAAMKSKLDCQQGHWGAFINYGSGKAWLQNNITTGDCRSVKQL